MAKKSIILRITPQTHVRTTQGDAIVFRIPEQCPVSCGQPRRSAKAELIPHTRRNGKETMVRSGCPHMLSKEGLDRKRRIERYNDYKMDLIDIAQAAGFEMPAYGSTINFFIPVPPSWTKKKKKQMHHQLHQSTPDTDNLLKAMQDALKKSDSSIAHFNGLAKWWINDTVGHIEIILSGIKTPPTYRPLITDELH